MVLKMARFNVLKNSIALSWLVGGATCKIKKVKGLVSIETVVLHGWGSGNKYLVAN